MNRTRAYTLIEMLATVGIIALLVSILLPMLLRARNSANRTRVAADLNTIATALDAYKQDFGDYPRLDATEFGTGFAVLGKALGSPYGDGVTIVGTTVTSDGNDPPDIVSGKAYHGGDCVEIAGYTVNTTTNTKPAYFYVAKVRNPDPSSPPSGSTTTNSEWAQYSGYDGADGPGFRVGRKNMDLNGDGIPDVVTGTPHRPYLEAGKIKFRGLAVLDIFDNPILYVPKNPTSINLANHVAPNPGRLIDQSSAGSVAMYDFDANGSLFRSMTSDATNDAMFAKSLGRMRVMLGDFTDLNGTGAPDGQISADHGETAAFTGPFILWSAGSDGIFGPKDDVSAASFSDLDRRQIVTKVDDITNFNVGQ